jgi:Leucine-rich repeat (LRR) protein
MDELKNLALNDIGIAYISKDAFSYLEDSLKHLELRENKLRSFPIAIQVLSHLESLDLFGNEIKTVPDDLTSYLQSSLKRLKRLTLNRMKIDLKLTKIIE